MILSHAQIEELAAAALKDFFGDVDSRINATDIDRFARSYLNLSISFAHLSDDGSLCGITAYADTEYRFVENGIEKRIPLKQNQVLLDSSFIQPNSCRKLCGKRRFTLAHECAHHLLFQLEADQTKASCRKMYATREAYSLRELKTKEDWNEWQANVMGAALLMPPQLVELLMFRFAGSRKLISYEHNFRYSDRMVLALLCQYLGVSKSALVIRLRELGFIEDKPYCEYVDPLEVLM